MWVDVLNDFTDESQYQTPEDKGRIKSGHLCLVLGRTHRHWTKNSNRIHTPDRSEKFGQINSVNGLTPDIIENLADETVRVF